DLRVLAFPHPHAFECCVEINTDQSLLFQGVGEASVPRIPDSMSCVEFERTIVNLLRKSNRGLNDHVAIGKHLGDQARALAQRNGVANRQSDGSASNQLWNRNEDWNISLRRGTDHRHGMRPSAGKPLKWRRDFLGEGQ